MKNTNASFKIKIFSFSIILAGALILFNVLLLDLKGRTVFVAKNFKEDIGVSIYETMTYPQRGTIFDSDNNIMANEINVYKAIFILSSDHEKYVIDENGNTVLVADYIEDPKYAASVVASILDADPQYLYERFTDDAYQVEIGEYGQNLTYEQKLELERCGINGIIFESSVERYYPNGTMASHLLGYTHKELDENGVYYINGVSGIERILDEQLTGKVGKEMYYSDPYGNLIAGGKIEKQECINGYNVHLTLNNVIQNGLEECLINTMNLSTKPDKAWGIVMDAKDGRILGYSSYPTFNANTNEFDDYNDYCAQLPYEPGSVMKSFIYAATQDIGTFNKDATYDNHDFYVTEDENGKIARSKTPTGEYGTITNYAHNQTSPMDFYSAYCQSLNVGCATLLEKYIDQDVFEDYLMKFGFTQPVNVLGIDEGEFYGSADFSSALSTINTSFGQAITANALQVIRAYSAFTNGGTMIKPRIIDTITDSSTNEVIYKSEKEEAGTPIKKETAEFMLMMMDGVVNSGLSSTSARYQIPDVHVGGKSGTAEVALPEGGYGSLTIHSMVIAMPIDDPQVLIYVCYQDNNEWTSQNISYINKLERVVANALNLTNKEETETESNKTIYHNSLENFVNHTLYFSKTKIDELELKMIELGNGQTIIKQYPEAGSTVITGEKIMLYTAGEIKMPDMTGWSRKDVLAFWDLTGISVKLDGYGFVKKQNIKTGEIINKESVIELVLE